MRAREHERTRARVHTHKRQSPTSPCDLYTQGVKFKKNFTQGVKFQGLGKTTQKVRMATQWRLLAFSLACCFHSLALIYCRPQQIYLFPPPTTLDRSATFTHEFALPRMQSRSRSLVLTRSHSHLLIRSFSHSLVRILTRLLLSLARILTYSHSFTLAHMYSLFSRN